MEHKISCIIPAYNEEKMIESTIETLLPLVGNDIYELIIINDHSNDKTKDIINTFSKREHIKILHNKKNLGKSKTVAHGIKQASGDFIFLLDADLLYLNTKNIKSLIHPIKSGQSKSVFAFVKNSWPLRPFKKIDYCNGQRIIPMNILKHHINQIEKLPSYGLEVFINKLLITNKISLKIIHRDNVENDFHQYRNGFINGRIKNLKIRRDIISISGGIVAIYKMNFDLEKLLQK